MASAWVLMEESQKNGCVAPSLLCLEGSFDKQSISNTQFILHVSLLYVTSATV